MDIGNNEEALRDPNDTKFSSQVLHKLLNVLL